MSSAGWSIDLSGTGTTNKMRARLAALFIEVTNRRTRIGTGTLLTCLDQFPLPQSETSRVEQSGSRHELDAGAIKQPALLPDDDIRVAETEESAECQLQPRLNRLPGDRMPAQFFLVAAQVLAGGNSLEDVQGLDVASQSPFDPGLNNRQDNDDGQEHGGHHPRQARAHLGLDDAPAKILARHGDHRLVGPPPDPDRTGTAPSEIADR